MKIDCSLNTLITLITVCVGLVSDARGAGTAFTYQGRLDNGGAPFSGVAEFVPSLWDAASDGSLVATNNPESLIVGVTNGLFTMPLDFGANFPGAARWLQLEVRTNPGPFTVLTPRQRISPTPYAITASQLMGTLPSDSLSGTYLGAVNLNNPSNVFSGSGAGLTSLNASELSSGTLPDARLGTNVARTSQVWLLGGNTGTTPGTQVLGTMDDQPIELHVNGSRALRLEPNSDGPNLIGGAEVNVVGPGVAGATIGGGGAAGYHTNRVNASFGTIGGGADNTLESGASYGTIAGGYYNSINAFSSFLGGGYVNAIRHMAHYATIGGGFDNTVDTDAQFGVIAGGRSNTIQSNAPHAAVGGGRANTVQSGAIYGTIGGGYGNGIHTGADSTTISGGSLNAIQTTAHYANIGGGRNNTVETNALSGTISGGAENMIRANAWSTTIAGGYKNLIESGASDSAVGGGILNANEANAYGSTIAGGIYNTNASGVYAGTVGGGQRNVIDGIYGTVPGGLLNRATNYALAAGRRAKASHTGAFVWSDSTDADFTSTATNQFNVRASGGVRLQTGGAGVTLDGQPMLTAGGNASQLTALNASQLASGTVPDARLSTNVALLNNVQTFSGTKTFSTPPAFTSVGTPFTVSSTSRVINLNADLLDGLNASAFAVAGHNHDSTYAKQGGNALGMSLILGTTDNQPLDFRVNGQQGFRLEPNAGGVPNVIGGANENVAGAGVSGATIAGGRLNTIQSSADDAAIGGGRYNTIGTNASYAIIGGGYFNVATASAATVSGGSSNRIEYEADFATIGGGQNNHVEPYTEHATIGGGRNNIAAAFKGTIGGGEANTIQNEAVWGVIGGGQNNAIQTNATHATIGGGYANTIQTSASYATIAGGRANTNEHDADYVTIGGGQFNAIQSAADNATIAGGYGNTIRTNAAYANIGGGSANTIQTDTYYAMIGGGKANAIEAAASYAAVAGGNENTIQTSSYYAAIGGGQNNTVYASGEYATIPGGANNAATNYAFAAGRRAKANHTGAFVWADSTPGDFASKTANEFSVRALGGVRLETGGAGGTLDGQSLLTAAGNASQLTGLNASQLASGIVPEARLSANVALLDNTQTFSGTKTFSTAPAFAAAGSPFTVSSTTKATNLNADLLDGLDSNAFALAGHNHDSTYAKQGGNALATTFTLGTTDNQPLEFKVNGQRALRLAPTADSSADADSLSDGAPNVIGGSPANLVSPGIVGATISGGGATNFAGFARPNQVASDYSTIGGGMQNVILTNATLATIAGGHLNTIEMNATGAAIGGGMENIIQPGATNATIGGGRANTIQPNSSYAVIGGGWGNHVQSSAHMACIAGGNANMIRSNSAYATISGGYDNVIQTNASYSTIGGGNDNTIQTNSSYATIVGGANNTIYANASWATIPGGQGNTATNNAFAAGLLAHAKHSGAFVWADSIGSPLDSAAANSVTMRAAGGYRLFSNPAASAGVSLAAGSGSWTSMSDRNAKENLVPVDGQAVLDKVVALPMATWNYKSQDATVRHLGPMAQDFKAAFGLGETDTGITSVDADGVALAAIQGLNQKLEQENAKLRKELEQIKQFLQKLTSE